MTTVYTDIKMTTIPESNSRTPTPRQDENSPSSAGDQQQVVQRSRWQAVLLEAGGIGAAVSEESMRRLKYCLQWLQVRLRVVLRFCTLTSLLVCNRPY